jgi:hypothetical protein
VLNSPLQRLALAAIAVTTAACGGSDMGDVTLQLATRRAAAAGTAQAAVVAEPGQHTVTLGSDEIVLDNVELVLRKIRVDGAPTASCPTDGEGDSQCGGVWLGPVLFELPLDQGADAVFTAAVPVGTYQHLKFQIHKPSDANGDAQFLADHPEFANTSIRATGTYNGTPFTFSSDLTEVEDVTLDTPVEVSDGGEVPVTLHVDVSGWFANEAGSGLLDPAQANGGLPLESVVEQNIRESFRAFHDGDADGAAD